MFNLNTFYNSYLVTVSFEMRWFTEILLLKYPNNKIKYLLSYQRQTIHKSLTRLSDYTLKSFTQSPTCLPNKNKLQYYQICARLLDNQFVIRAFTK